MERTRRHGIYYVASMVGLLLLYTLLYKYGMAAFEGVHRGFLESANVVIQSVTTTGYGEDAPWSSAPMLVLMIVMQVTGVFYIFLTLPLFLVPWIERRLENALPGTYDGSDHVVVCGLSAIGDEFLDELEATGSEYVVVLSDGDRVRELIEEGYTAVEGDPESAAALEGVSVASARSVVLDASDERNATIALAVREVSDTVPMTAFVEDPDRSTSLELAGVTETLNPRELLGRALAGEVSRIIKTELGETVDVGGAFQVIELPVLSDSDLVGRRLRETDLRERTGASVIGAWVNGEFVPNPDPNTAIDRGTVLLVSGTEAQLQSAIELAAPTAGTDHEETIVVGYGDTGRAVHRALESARISCRIVDMEPGPAVDVVGDAAEQDVLRSAGIEDAGVLIVAIGEDTDAIFVTLLARELNPDVEILVRANDTENRGKLVAAGADYVLPLATVSARLLADTITGEEVISYGTQIDVVRSRAPAFTGQTVDEADIRERTGVTVLAVERGETVHTEIGPSFELEAGDELIVAGTAEDIETFRRASGARDA